MNGFRYPTVNPEDRPRCIEREYLDGEWRQCPDKAAVTKLGDRIIAVNTKFCAKHSRKFADDRLTDPEANAL